MTDNCLKAEITDFGMKSYSPQSLGTWHLSFQHVTDSYTHGLMANALVIVLAITWVPLLINRNHRCIKFNIQFQTKEYSKSTL